MEIYIFYFLKYLISLNLEVIKYLLEIYQLNFEINSNLIMIELNLIYIEKKIYFQFDFEKNQFYQVYSFE